MSRGSARRRASLIAASVVLGLLAAAVVTFGLRALGGHRSASPQAAQQPPVTHPGALAGKPAGATETATVLRTAPRFASPGVSEPGTVPAQWWQRPSVLPVIATRPGWVQVRLAQRPNGTAAWLRASDVRLGTTPYRIVIDLATTHLMLYENGRMIVSAPAGVGAQDDPTPAGQYFVAFRESPPGPGYGPFVLVTSAHSPNISDWDGSGDAIIGIHGPLGEDSQIGTAGARISHGCVRLHLQSLASLSSVPPGTPIDITG